MRHHRSTDNPHRDGQRLCIRQLRRNHTHARRSPVHRYNEHLDQVTQGNNRDQAADHQLYRAEPLFLHHQQSVGNDRGHPHSRQQRHMEQQGKRYSPAEELRQIGCHRRHFTEQPHADHHRARKLIAAHLCQIALSDDTQLGRQRLEQHGDQVGHHHHP
ncbi:hypothetical protein D3C71_1300750 [compost metagenome]